MAKTKKQSWIAKRIDIWSAKRAPFGKSITLNRKNILILPTGFGVLFAVISFVIFIAAINYENSLLFGLAFLMISLFVVLMFHSFANLNGLRLSALSTSAVYLGEEAAFQVLLSRTGKRRHEALELNFPGSSVTRSELLQQEDMRASVFCATQRRGEFRAPRLTVRTYFPSGLFFAWSVVNLDLRCLVYPTPTTVALGHLLEGSGSEFESALIRSGTSDFHGLRGYVPGDSMKQVAWKNVARGQGMQVKQFVDYIDDRMWLDWDMFYGFGDEERLSRLCYCVLKLSASGRTFGLKLPGVEIEPDSGNQQKLRTLKALALFREPDAFGGEATR